MVNFADCLNQFEDRFLADQDKALLLAILDSLASGKQIQVQKTVVNPLKLMTNAQAGPDKND